MATDITFGIIDVTAKKDSSLLSGDKQAFSALADLRRDGVKTPHVVTGEDYQWLLDGSYETFPDDPGATAGWGWFSRSMSGGDGSFANPPTLTITFTRAHSSAGVTLKLADLCPYTVQVQWYDLAGELMDDKIFELDGTETDCFLDNPVYDYGKLVVSFLASGLPHRYVRVYGVEYGLVHSFAGAELAEANLFEEIDPTMATLQDNTLDVKVLSSDVNFSILEPKGVYTMLSENQPLTVTHDGVYFGTYYLNEWEVSDMWIDEADDGPENWTTATFRCVSPIGVLDQTRVLGGVYVNAALSSVVAEIMEGTAVDYIIDDTLKDTLINGWLSICTAREALQQVVFAAGAIADCSRRSFVHIYPITARRPTRAIGRDRKLSGGVIRLKPFVSGVEVVGHTYTQVTTDAAATLFTGKPGEGDHQIEFSMPSYGYAVTNCTLVKSGPNYAVIRVTAAQSALEQKITGKNYREGTSSATVGDLLTRVDNVVKVPDATLVTEVAAPGIARRLYDYYQRRHESEGGILLGDEQCGDTASIFAARKATSGGEVHQTIVGDVLSLEIDLMTDTVEKAVIRGVPE